MNSTSGHSWIWTYAAVAGLFAYYCTRGADGEPILTLYGFGLLGLVYWVLMWLSERASITTALKHLIIVESAVVTAFIIEPFLKELSGILYLIIPVYVAAIVASGWLVQLLRRRPVEEPVPRCPKCNYVLIGLSTPRCPECGTTFSDIAKDSES